MVKRFSPQLDVIVVLGKNIGVVSTSEAIWKRITHLSDESKMNLLAAHAVWKRYQHDHARANPPDIFFSTGGNTAGADTQGHELPGEATLQADDFKGLFSDVSEKRIIVSKNPEAIDTAGDAVEVAKIVKEKGYRHVGVVTVGYHLDNAVTLFKRYGVPVEQTFAAEDIVGELSPKFAEYVKQWKKTRVKREKGKEFIRKILLHTIDPKGKLLHIIATITRTGRFRDVSTRYCLFCKILK